MGGKHGGYDCPKKSVRQTERPFSSALFILRCLQVGLSLTDLDYLTVGNVFDIISEKQNDGYEWDELATAEDISRF